MVNNKRISEDTEPPDILQFFQEEMVDLLSDHPHPLSLKSRILRKMQLALQKPLDWVSVNPHPLFQKFENEEFVILQALIGLTDIETDGICAVSMAVI